jgi:hypothetical protein
VVMPGPGQYFGTRGLGIARPGRGSHLPEPFGGAWRGHAKAAIKAERERAIAEEGSWTGT